MRAAPSDCQVDDQDIDASDRTTKWRKLPSAMPWWTKLNMLAHYAHGLKSDKLEA